MFSARRSPLFTVMGLLAVSASHAAADVAADARKAIQVIYDHEVTAYAKKDIKGITAILTPDFESIEKNGDRINAVQSIETIRQTFRMLRTFTVSQNIQNLTLKGDQAIVTSRSHLEGTIADEQTGKPHKVVGDSVTVETWVKSRQGWLLKRSKTISERNIMDGKPQS